MNQYNIIVQQLLAYLTKRKPVSYTHLTDFCGLLSTADYFFKRIQIPVKIAHDLLSGQIGRASCRERV